MKSLTLKKLEQDNRRLEQLIRQRQNQVIQADPILNRYNGVLAYINDNIKELKGEVENDRDGTNKEG